MGESDKSMGLDESSDEAAAKPKTEIGGEAEESEGEREDIDNGPHDVVKEVETRVAGIETIRETRER